MPKILNLVAAIAIIYAIVYCSYLNSSYFYMLKSNEIDDTQWIIEFFTANYAHFNIQHMAENVLAFIVIWFFFFLGYGNNIICKLFTLLVTSIATTIGVAFFTEIDTYGGLSGALHGMVATAALLRILTEKDNKGFIILGLLAIKLAVEYYYPNMTFDELSQRLYGNTMAINDFLNNKSLRAYSVATEAHFFGVLGGILASIVCFIHFKTQPKLLK